MRVQDEIEPEALSRAFKACRQSAGSVPGEKNRLMAAQAPIRDELRRPPLPNSVSFHEVTPVPSMDRSPHPPKTSSGSFGSEAKDGLTSPLPSFRRKLAGSIFGLFKPKVSKEIPGRGSVFSRRWSLGSADEGDDERQSAKSAEYRNRFEKGFTMVEEEELGIAFCTRAKMKRKKGRESHLLLWLRWLFGKLSAESPQNTTWHVITSKQLSMLLKVSALISFSTVMALVALEPICVESSEGPLFARLGQGRGDGLNVMMLLHFLNSLLYLFGSITYHLHLIIMDEASVGVFDITLQFSSNKRCTFHWKVMLLDFVGFIGTIAEWIHLGESAGAVPSPSLWMMLFHCAKMWRFLLPTVLVLDSRADSYTRGVASSFLWLVFLSHAAAIVLLVLAVQERGIGVVSWIDNMVAEGQACGVIYIESVYFAALSITSVGYGDILVSPLERACNAFLLILGQLFVAKICADVTWLTSLHNLEETKNQSQKAQTSVALKHLQVPMELTERVLAYQSFVQHVHREEDLDQPAFHGLSTPLMQELRLAAYRKLILKAPFLREQKKHVISMMVSSLSDLIYLPADFIVCSGDTGRELFFMRRGVAGVYPSGPECPPVWGESSEVAEYTAGKYFGELGMLTARPRAAWIMAKTYCVLSVLPYHTVELLRDDHPEAFTTLVQSMVRVFKLEPSTTWQSVAEKLLRKMSFTTTDEAFRWFCEQGYETAIPEDPPLLKAKSFEYVLKFLGVNEADRMILWAEMDADNTGQVTKDEFEEKLDIDFAARKYAKALAAVQSNPLLRSATTMHLGAVSSGGNLSSSLPARIKPNGDVKFQRNVSREAEKEEMYQLMKDTVRHIAEEYYSGDKKNRFSSGTSTSGPRVHFPAAPSQPAPERPVEAQKSS